MSSIEARIDGREIDEALGKIERRGRDLTPTMAIIAEMLVVAVQDEFETEGGGEWPELAASTIAKRRKGSGGVKILQDTGNMAGSVEASHGSDFAEAATGVSYAIHHVYGAPKANVPQRNPFDIPDEAFDDALEVLLGAVTR